jgi:hypothetical protein
MTESPKHIDATQKLGGPPSENQYRPPFGLSISFPEVVVIKMVDASGLNDYEFAVLFASIFASAAVGFLVAFLQSTPPQDAKVYLIVTLLFAALFVGFLIYAGYKRHKLTAKSKTFRLQAVGVEEVSQGSPSTDAQSD